MPTYAYACTSCDHTFEVVQSFSDDSLTVCPECQGRLRKLYNAVGVVFKGSGFYRNDSRESAKKPSSSSSTKENGSPAKEHAGSTTASSGSGDTASAKPAAASSSTGPSSGSTKSTTSS